MNYIYEVKKFIIEEYFWGFLKCAGFFPGFWKNFPGFFRFFMAGAGFLVFEDRHPVWPPLVHVWIRMDFRTFTVIWVPTAAPTNPEFAPPLCKVLLSERADTPPGECGRSGLLKQGPPPQCPSTVLLLQMFRSQAAASSPAWATCLSLPMPCCTGGLATLPSGWEVPALQNNE